ncbi:MAG: hypothetical protein U5N85_09930 [Arcicella sp.]|nr:hypothetical protein [Arcicella sp.]
MKNNTYKFLSIPMLIFTLWACVKDIEPIPASVNDVISISSTNNFKVNSDVKFSANASNYSNIKWEFLLGTTVINTSNELSPNYQIFHFWQLYGSIQSHWKRW